MQGAAYHQVSLTFKVVLLYISYRASQLEEKEKALLGAELEANVLYS